MARSENLVILEELVSGSDGHDISANSDDLAYYDFDALDTEFHNLIKDNDPVIKVSSVFAEVLEQGEVFSWEA